MKFWQVVANCFCVHRFTDSFTDNGHSARRNSLLLMQLNLEARVGIGRLRPQRRSKSALFQREIKLNLPNQTQHTANTSAGSFAGSPGSQNRHFSKR